MLGTKAFHLDVGAVAGWTLLRHLDGIAAVVAFQQIRFFVVGERYVAVLAFGHRFASVADHAHRIAASVLEQDDLLLALQRRRHLLNEEVRKKPLDLFPAGCEGHVNGVYVREFAVCITLHQLHQPELVKLHVEVSFQRGSGGAEKGFGPMNLRKHHSSIAGVIARGGINLLVRSVVFFIHNDQP